MGKRSLAWRELNYLEALDVLRGAETAVVAVKGPWATVMHVQLEMDGVQPVLHLSGRGEGRRLAGLAEDPHAMLLFRREDCAGTDTVAVEGEAELTPAEAGVLLRIPARTLSGRRYFHQG